MRPHLDIAHAGTVDMDDKTRMTFDEESAAHLMSILTDLYSDRAMAVVREYSTNARDSHLAAGVDLPIAVTTPTSLNPVLRIQDFGLGMSVDDILHNFSKYGWSSKRDNDIQNGMLGLGCKSALTYSSQFTMIAVKDGVKATVLITRDSDGAGAIKVIDTCSTDDGNGVEIQVPVVNVTDMNSKVEQFFSYWNPGEVLVDGVQPYSVWNHDNDDLVHSNVTRLDDDVIVLAGHGRSSVIVMGGVAYPAVDLMPKRWANDVKAIVRVQVGQVNFVPSREALASTQRTADTIATAREFIDERLERVLRQQIDSLPSRWEAREFLESHPARLSLSNVTYRGELIPRSSGFDTNKTFALLVEPWQETRETADTQYFTPWKQAEAAALNVTGFNLRYVTKLSKDLARFWIDQNNSKNSFGRDQRRILFHAGSIPLEWMRPTTKVISFDELRQLDLPTTQSPAKPKSKWRYMWANGAGFGETESLNFDNVAAWVGVLDARTYNTIISRALDRYDKPYAVVLTEKQVAKFKADHPDIPHISTWVDRKYREFIKGLSPIEVIALRSRDGGNPVLDELRDEIEGLSRFKRMTRKMQRATLLDLELRKVVELTEVLAANTELANQRSAYSSAWHAFCSFPHNPLFGIEPRLPQPDYSLVQYITSVVKRYPILQLGFYFGGKNDAQIVLDALNNTYLSRQMLHLHPSTY